MRLPSKAIIEQLRQQFPAGTQVELVRMDDAQAPPVGTQGTVLGVDDTGSLLMAWDNGSGLNVVYGEDVVRKISCEKHHKIHKKLPAPAADICVHYAYELT